MCVAFAGSNSDVKPNDRIPMIPEVHEPQCKRKSCLRMMQDYTADRKVKKRILKRSTVHTQRMQSATRGYFGGYIGKRQPAGGFELKKSIKNFFTLRGKIAGQGRSAQLRAASGRLMTDLEMNSTFRGAVEGFNLCRNLRKNDVRFAE